MSKPYLIFQRNRSERGFTLIELMVVIVIISIMLGYLVISIGGSTQDKSLQDEAKRITALIKLASEQSLLQSIEIGLLIDDNLYMFLSKNEQSWASLPENNFRSRKLPDNVQMEFVSIDNAPPPEETEELMPQVLLLSSGEMTPFELEIRDDDIDYYFTLSGSAIGKLTLLPTD